MDSTEKNYPPPYDPGFNNQQYGQHNPNAPTPSHGMPPPHGMPQPHGGPYGPPGHVGGNPYGTPQHAPVYVQPVVTPSPVQMSTTNTVVVNAGGGVGVGCPVCHNNTWTGSYSCCAWMWLICCFPVGIICCCCMRRKKCTKCGYTVG